MCILKAHLVSYAHSTITYTETEEGQGHTKAVPSVPTFQYKFVPSHPLIHPIQTISWLQILRAALLRNLESKGRKRRFPG